MRVMVGGGERYIVSDNTKKISRSHDEKLLPTTMLYSVRQ